MNINFPVLYSNVQCVVHEYLSFNMAFSVLRYDTSSLSKRT